MTFENVDNRLLNIGLDPEGGELGRGRKIGIRAPAH